MKHLADRICGVLRGGQPLAVATILARSGSAPRTAGSKMVVEQNGRFAGTIGGGKFEADVLAASAGVLGDGRPKTLFFDLTHDDVSAMDMICGGQMDVLIDYLAPEEATVRVFEAWRDALGKTAAGALITAMLSGDAGLARTEHCMVFADGTVAGNRPRSKELLTRLARASAKGGLAQIVEADRVRLLVEPVSAPHTLFIFGAGHVSMPTARMAAAVGFRVVVIDDRREFANRDRFAEADEIRIPEHFSSAMAGLPVDAKSFVVIVTRGHGFDKTVLAQALQTEVGYIGMIGSRRKRDAIYSALRKEGVSDADLGRVHCPIGLSIGAESPEEIAVSIVAELIAERARMTASCAERLGSKGG